VSDWLALGGVKGGPAIRPGSSMPSSAILRLGGRTVLVDAGLGAARAVCDQGVALTDLDLVLITHLHSDHYLELGPLIHTAWTCGRTHPLTVIGPVGLEAYWRHFLAAMAFDVALRVQDEGRVPLAGLVRLRAMAEGELWCDGALTVEALRNRHPPIAESFALRLSAAAGRVVLSGDTAPFEGWAAFCAGADLLVHEVMLATGVDALMATLPHAAPALRAHILRSHTEAADAARLATAARVGALAVTHFVPDGLPGFGPDRYEAALRAGWDGPLHLGRDGMRIAL
jgi:ribonuclease BN (tRNA processing enzyme)